MSISVRNLILGQHPPSNIRHFFEKGKKFSKVSLHESDVKQGGQSFFWIK